MARKKVIEIVLDTETTGLDFTRERLVEFAAVRLENGKIKDSFQTLINPEQHIRKSSIAIHGITQEMVADAPTEAEAMPKIIEFIEDLPLIAHNNEFDLGFINVNLNKLNMNKLNNKNVDTLLLAKKYLPQMYNYKLETLKKYFKINQVSHRAVGDCYTANYVYQECKKKACLK